MNQVSFLGDLIVRGKALLTYPANSRHFRVQLLQSTWLVGWLLLLLTEVMFFSAGPWKQIMYYLMLSKFCSDCYNQIWIICSINGVMV